MNVFELFASLSLKADSYFSGLDSAEKALSNFGGEIGNVIGTLQTVDNLITQPFDTAVSAIANGLSELAEKGTEFVQGFVQEGMNFDSAMSQVGATLIQTRDDMDATTVSVDGFNGTLREFAKKLGAETKFTATQSAEALNYMALAGYDAQTSAEMLPKVLNLAAAGAMDLGTASDMVTDAQTALGLSLDDTTILIDQMAKTASSSNTSVSQLGDAILAIGATARDLKGGFTELNTALGVLADNGIKASEGGNTLRRLITRLAAPTGEAAAKMEELGFSAYDAQDNMKSLPDIFMELNQAMAGLTDKQRKSAITDIFGQYALAGANALLNTSAERWETLTGKIQDSAGAAQEMADIQLDTLPGQITILQSAFSGLKTELYEKVSPMTREFIETLSSGLSDVTAEIAEGDWGAAFSKLGETAVELINKGIDTILNSEDTVAEFVDGFLTFTEKVADSLLDSGSIILPQLLNLALDIAGKVVSGVAEFIGNDENEGKIRATIGQMLTSAEKFLEEHEDDFFTIADTVIDIILGFIPRIFVLRRKTTWDLVKREFKSIWSKGYEAFSDFDSELTLKLIRWFQHLPKKLKQLYDLTDFFEIYNQIKEDSKNNMDDIFKDIQDKTSTWLTKTLPDKIKQWYDLGTLKQAFVDGWQPIIDDAKNWGTDLIQNFIDGISGMKDKIAEKVGEVASTISDFLHHSTPEKGPLANDDEWMPDFMQGMAEGIEKNRGLIQKATENVAMDMQKALPTTFDINTDIVNKSVPTQSKLGGNTLELHIENFYNNRQDDVQKLGRALYSEIFREKAATN